MILINVLLQPGALIVLVVGSIAYYVIKYTYRLWFHPLAAIPGPRLARASSLWATIAASKLQKAHAIQEAHEEYGSVVRVGPNELSFSSPTVLKSIYGQGAGLPKSDFYKAGKFSTEESIFSLRDRRLHSGRRSMISRSFSHTSVMEYVPLFMEKIEDTFNQLSRLSCDGRDPINIYHWVHWFALDIVFHFTFGQESGTIRTGAPHPIIRDLESFQAAFAWTALFPALRQWGHKVPIQAIRKPFEHLRDWIEFCLEQARCERRNDKQIGLVNNLVNGVDNGLGRPLTDLEIAEEMIGMMFAGSGTAANTTVFLIYAVLRDSKILEKLTEELEIAAPHPTDTIRYEVASTLPYTNAVILEALRRYPTIPGMQPRQVIDKEIFLEGYCVPAGTIVGVQNYTLHRNEKIFPNPEAFQPERWLSKNCSNLKEAFNGFGTGPRACIGRNLAMMEMQLFVSAFFRRFAAAIAPSMTEADMVMIDGFSGGPLGQKLELYLQDRRASNKV